MKKRKLRKRIKQLQARIVELENELNYTPRATMPPVASGMNYTIYRAVDVPVDTRMKINGVPVLES